MGDIKEIIEFRVKRSDEAFEDALLLREIGHYNSSVNRLYYSAFYAVSGLLLKHEVYSKTHSGLKSKFNEVLIYEKRLSQEEADTYNELFENTQDADYKDLVVFSKEEVDPLFDRTKNLINKIKKLIN